MIKNQEEVGFIPLIGLKLNQKGDVAATETNHILCLLIILSTRIVEPIILKETVSDEVLVPPESRFEEGSRKTRV